MRPLTRSPLHYWKGWALSFPRDERKLIAQAYDGASVMRGATGGVQCQVQDVYGSAYYDHCYAHQLNLKVQGIFIVPMGQIILQPAVTKTINNNHKVATRYSTEDNNNSSCSRQHPTLWRSATSFPILAVFLHFFPSHSSELQCLMRWWRTDFPVLQQRDGTSTVSLLTQFTSTRMTWPSVFKPSRIEVTLIPQRRERGMWENAGRWSEMLL